jgi:predicted ATP-grasp superfamily ATP-dependent carboligase
VGKINILIVDGLHRIGLAVARSLKLAGGYKVHMAIQNTGWLSSVQRELKSNAVDRIHFLPVGLADKAILYYLRRLIHDYKIDFLLPAGHHGTLYIAQLKKDLSRLCTVLAPDYEKVLQLHDKRSTVKLAGRAGIPCPITVFPRNQTAVESYAKNCTYPVVVKAAKGAGADGVWYASNATQLIQAYQVAIAASASCDGFIRDTSSPLLQEYIPGHLHDVAAFSLDGELKAALTQKRLLTKPLKGGKGIVNTTTYNSDLIALAGRFIGHIRWHGVVLFDFKIDRRDGIPKLLEVNPRFWGTTWLTTCAGFNFPHNLVLAARRQPLYFPPKYQVDLVCRWPLYEIGTILEKPRSVAIILQKIKDFVCRFRSRPTVYDILWSDPKPFVAEVITRLVGTWRSLIRRGRA